MEGLKLLNEKCLLPEQSQLKHLSKASFLWYDMLNKACIRLTCYMVNVNDFDFYETIYLFEYLLVSNYDTTSAWAVEA